jgi:hypothetical protein
MAEGLPGPAPANDQWLDSLGRLRHHAEISRTQMFR